MTKIEKIEDLLGQVEADITRRVIRDILADLKDFAESAIESEKAGFQAAIEVIQANCG